MKFKIGDYVWVHIIHPFKKDFLCQIKYINDQYQYPYVCEGLNGEVMYADDEWASEYKPGRIPDYFKLS